MYISSLSGLKALYCGHMTHEHLTPTEAIAYSVNKTMAENTGENREGQPPRRQNQPSRRAADREAIEDSRSRSGEGEVDVEQAATTILDRLVEERRATKGESEEEARREILAELDVQTGKPEAPPAEAAAGGAGGEEPPKEPPAPAAGTPKEPQRPSPRSQREAQEEELRAQFRSIVEGNPAIREELLKDDPDFSKPEMGTLKDLLDKKIYPVTGLLTNFATYISELRIEDQVTAGGQIQEKQISENSKKVMFEWLVERIISIPDKGSPDTRYSIGGFQMQGDLDELILLAQTHFDPEFTRYIQELIHIRAMAHELNRSFKFGESYKKYVIEELSASGMNFLQNDIAGIDSVLRLYEKISAQKIAEKKTWFSSEDVNSVDEDVGRLFEGLCGNGSITKGGRKLTDWEIKRSLRLAKILFSGSQRYAMYAVQGDLPKDWTERIGSIPLEFVARALVPLKLISARFFGDPGQIQLMKYMTEEIEKTGKYVPLFGLDKRTIMFNTNGIFDPESHSWRSPLLFLSNIRIGGTTLKDHLADNATIYGGGEDPLFGGVHMTDEEKGQFSRAVEDYVLGQRLYLSILSRYGDFDEKLKTKIWQKIASLKPSTIASLLGTKELFPTEADSIAWGTLRDKLYIAEEMRVERESRKYKDDPYTGDELRDEAEKFKGDVIDADKYQILNSFGDGELTTQEVELLRRIIDKGYEKAEILAGASMPYTYCIDDVAKISWSKSESGTEGSTQEDLIRLIYSDQDSLNKSWTEINSLIESPTGDFVEHFAKAVDGYASVHGREAAQTKFEPFIIAYFKFVETKGNILWTPGAMTMARLLRKPTSEIEKYSRSSFMSLDEQDRSDALTALAQAKAISDDTRYLKEGMTHLDWIRKKTKSDRLSLALRMARIIIMMFGPVAGYEFLKVLLPPDILKALG